MRRFVRIVRAGLVPLLLLVLPGCSLFFQRPSVSVVGVDVGSVGLEGATAEIALEIRNPNRYDLDVSEVRYTLAVRDHPASSGGAAPSPTGDEAEWRTLLDGAVPDSVTVPGGRTTRIVVDVPFPYEALERAGEAFLQGRGRLPYRLAGQLRVRGPMTTVRVPFDEEGVLDPLADLLERWR